MTYFLAVFSLLEHFVAGFGVGYSFLQDLPDDGQQGGGGSNDGALLSPVHHLAIKSFAENRTSLPQGGPTAIYASAFPLLSPARQYRVPAIS
jgi:hypothetical protein